MPPQASPEKTASNYPIHRISEGIVSSLANLAQSAGRSSPNSPAKNPSVSNYYLPPKGSQIIPHPRTIPDLLFRSIFIQLCAVLGYALFLQILRQTLLRTGRRVSDLPGPWWIWPLCSVLLPELVLVQIGLWSICGLCPSIAESLSIGSSLRSQPRVSQRIIASPHSALPILLQTMALLVPLYYAGKGYKERLSMRYHEANYVGNLGLDHRNGWSMISGLVSGIAIVLLSLFLLFQNRQAVDRSAPRHSGASKHLDAIAEEDEEEDEEWQLEEKDDIAESNGSKRKNSNESPRQSSNGSATSTASSASSQSRPNSIVALLQDPETILTLVLASTIHHIPLAATNRLPPLTAVITTRWCLSLIPVTFISVFTLPHSQRLAFWRALFSRSGSDKMLVLFTLLRTMAMVIPWLLVGTTILVQFWSDLSELKDVGYGILQPWNYRWQVKDIFSHSDADKVYMG